MVPHSIALLVPIAVLSATSGCFPQHSEQAPTAPASVATAAPEAFPTFAPDSSPDLDRAAR